MLTILGLGLHLNRKSGQKSKIRKKILSLQRRVEEERDPKRWGTTISSVYKKKKDGIRKRDFKLSDQTLSQYNNIGSSLPLFTFTCPRRHHFKSSKKPVFTLKRQNAHNPITPPYRLLLHPIVGFLFLCRFQSILVSISQFVASLARSGWRSVRRRWWTVSWFEGWSRAVEGKVEPIKAMRWLGLVVSSSSMC